MKSTITFISAILLMACSGNSNIGSSDYIAADFLDSISCPLFVVAPKNNSAKCFHLSADCPHIKSILSKYSFVHRDSIPAYLRVCKFCADKSIASHKSISDTAVSVYDVEPRKLKTKKAIRKQSKIAPAPRSPMDEPVE